MINMESVKVEQIEWLLYPFIPFGKVTIIQGDPGEGKTTMVLQIIAKLTRGEPILLNKKSQKEAQQDSEENLKQEVLSQDNLVSKHKIEGYREILSDSPFSVAYFS